MDETLKAKLLGLKWEPYEGNPTTNRNLRAPWAEGQWVFVDRGFFHDLYYLWSTPEPKDFTYLHHPDYLGVFHAPHHILEDLRQQLKQNQLV